MGAVKNAFWAEISPECELCGDDLTDENVNVRPFESIGVGEGYICNDCWAETQDEQG